MTAKVRWGDTLDEDDVLPPTTVSGPDAKGIKTITEYRKNDKGDVVKVTTKLKNVKIEKKIYKSVEDRRAWARFGDAKSEQKGDSVTVRAVEDIPFERVRLQKQTQSEKKVDLAAALAAGDKAGTVTSLKDMLYKRRMQRQLDTARGLLQPEMPPDEDGGSLPTAGTGKAGSYVPPSVRNRGGAGAGDSMHRREENSVRVTNLSEDTREDDLRDLFSPFGPISRIYIAYDRDTGENRGFAFVNFTYKADAALAIEKLNGFGYDNLILKLEWATPRDSKKDQH